MKHRIFFLLLCGIIVAAHAQNTTFTYQGRVQVSGTDFSGMGQFKFALITSSNANHRATASSQPMTGGNFSLIGGFWSLFAVQSPSAPFLTIRLTTPNSAIVSWPSPSTGFTLQQNADLLTTDWVAAPQTGTDNGTNRFIIVNPPAGDRFYRLFKP